MRRWLILALGTGAQTAACVFVYGLPYMSDELRHDSSLSLSQVGLVVACPTAGLVLALVAWGALADRIGERIVITAGLTATAALLALGTQVNGLVPLGLLFALSGAAGASVYAASGRLVMGWFSAEERGLAMGIRQTSTPLGMGVAALCIPALSQSFGVQGPGVFCAALCALFALLVGTLAVNPLRRSRLRAPNLRSSPAPRTATRHCGASTAPAPFCAYPSSRQAPSPWSSWWTYAVTVLSRPARSSPSPRSSALFPAWWQAVGRTAWPAGCAPCANWPGPRPRYSP